MPIVREARELIVRVYRYFELESQHGGPLLPVQQVRARAAAALGVGSATVSRILKEKYGRSGMEDNELKTPDIGGRRKKRAQHQPNGESLNTDNDSAVPNPNTSKETANNATNKMMTIEKTDPPNKRKRKVDQSEAFNVDELLNYVPKDKPASVTQDGALDHEIGEMAASDTAVKEVHTGHRLTPQIKNNEPLPRKPKAMVKEGVNINEILIDDSKIENPAVATTQNTGTNNKTAQQKVNEQVDIEHCELKSYKIYTENNQTVVKESVADQSLPDPVLHGKKSIAKADFQVGRIKNNDCDPRKGFVEKCNIELIKDHVKAYHTMKVTPGIKTLMVSLRDSGLFNGSKENLLQILEKIGFCLKKPDKI